MSSFGLSLNALGGKLGGQWEKDRRDTLFLMLGAFASCVPHFGHLPIWVSTVFVALYVWRLGLVLSGRWLPRDLVRWVAAIACVIGVYAHYKTLLGRDAGVALLVLFLGLKLMEMRARRDLFVVIYLCFFILVTSFFYSQSILTAGLVVGAVWALLAAMLTMHYGPVEVPFTQRFKSVGILLLQAAPLAAALFFLFPRIQQPLWGLPADAHTGRTGMSEKMAPGSISQLNSSPEVAFRVKFDEQEPLNGLLYWRGPVLGEFDGRTWQPLTQSLTPRGTPEILYDPATQVNYSITLEPNNQRWLFALDSPSALNDQSLADLQARINPDGIVESREPITSRTRYRLSSATNYRMNANDPPLARQNWLSLPPSFNPETLGLAMQWQRESQDPEKLVQKALTHFFKEPFFYTTKPPLLGRNSVDDFLFRTRAGFCEHYASAFVVLMRALDIPARVVTGYYGGEKNKVDGYFVVRQSEAHAWAEVWMEGKGWIRIDPTSSIAPNRIEKGTLTARTQSEGGAQQAESGWLSKLKQNSDAITNSWNQWVLNYDKSSQKKLFERFGLNVDEWGEVAALLAAVLGVLIGIAALITLRPRLPKDPVERSWKILSDKLGEKGLQRSASETSLQWITRIQGELEAKNRPQFKQICKMYNQLRYASNESKAKDVRHLRSLVRQFRC